MEDIADDDFGELYGDLQLLVTSPPQQEQQQEHQDYDNDDGARGDGNVKNNDADADADYLGSDSDDDLNIVLNDDDHRDISIVPDEDVRGDSLGNNTECVDQLKDEAEHVSSDAHVAWSRNGVNGAGYGSQFFRSKYTRTQEPVFVNNVKSSKSMGLTFDSSSFRKGRGNSTQNQLSSSSYFDGGRDRTNLMSMSATYGSFLPWHMNIYDVNIDKLEEKPWRIPGADITDYFNFDFNENTWKQYCMSLGQLWQTSTQVGIPVNESAKLNQASTRELIDQAVSGSLVSPSSKCEVPKGRAIQVENSVVERQPSFNARRPCSITIDSDVVIQINVDGSSDNNSGYVDSNVNNLSEEEEFISGNSRNKNCSSSEHDVLFEEQLEDVKKSDESSGQKRNDLVPDTVKAQQLDREDQHSEDAEVLEEEMKIEERVCVLDTCSVDPCWSEPELSLDDQDLSLTSYTDNDSEETGDSLRGDNEKNHSPFRSHLANSDADLKKSESLHHKISKKQILDKTPVNVSYYSRHGGPLQQGRKHHTPYSKLKKHVENDNDVSHIPKSSGRNTSRWGHQFVNYRPKERVQYFGSHKRRYVSYNSETKQSWYHGAEKTVDDLVQAAYSEYSDREEGDNFRENANQYIRKDGNRREYFFERRTVMEYNEDHDWHPANRNHHVNDDNPSLLSYRESRQFHPKHSSFPVKDRETQRRRMHHQPHYKDRNCNYDQWFDECEFEFLNRSGRMPSSFAEREMEFLNDNDEEKFPQIDRALKRYAGRDRQHDSPPLVGNTLWSWKPDDDLDECPRYMHHQTSYSRYQKQPYAGSARDYVYSVNENLRGHERHGHATDRGSDWHSGYTDAAEDEDCITFPVKGCEFYPHPYEVPDWTNNDNDNVIWHHDELHPEENPFFYEETPKRERYRHSHPRVQITEKKIQRHQLNLSSRDRDRFLKRSSKVLSRDNCQQAVLSCSKSVNLIDRDGKSHAKSSRVSSNGRLENVDHGIAKKKTALVGFDESHENTIKFGISKSLCGKENKKSLQNLSHKGQKESLDVEEGEIQTEEPSLEASVYHRDVSEDAALTDTVKKRRSQNGNDSELHTGNLDSQKILDTIAKMEKRRERFKQPISIIKEAEKRVKLNADSAVVTDKINEVLELAVDTNEIKQHRPARKRRWNGS